MQSSGIRGGGSLPLNISSAPVEDARVSSDARRSTSRGESVLTEALGAAPKVSGTSMAPRTLKLGGDRQTRNFEQAEQRLHAFFGEKSAALHEKDHKEATEVIDDYLAKNGHEVPAELRSLLITMAAHMNDVDRALPFGRGNVLTRQQPGGAIEVDRYMEKNTLKYLGEKAFEKIENPRGDQSIQLSAKSAATGILTGSGSCVNYTHLFALKMAQVINRMPEPKRAVSMFIHTSPYVGNKPNRFDHVYGVLGFTDANDVKHEVMFDPFADKNRVMLAQDSLFHGAYVSESPLKRVDDHTPALVLSHMKNADGELKGVRNSPVFQQKLDETNAETRELDANGKHYGLAETLAKFKAIDAPVDNAKPDVKSILVRRRTLNAAKDSPLLSDN